MHCRIMHQDVLEWLLFLNTHDEFTFYYSYGDKDTFRAAFMLAGKGDQYNQVGGRAAVQVFRVGGWQQQHGAPRA